jgi:dTDP-glucose pyrophosphorylase
MSTTLLVLAAGMGSRFGGLKQIDSFGPSGETIIDYSIYDAVKAGFNKVVFVIRHEFEEEFKNIVSNKYRGKIEVEFAYQELTNLPEGISKFPERIKPWGTGHAVWCARNVISDAFAVINADDFYGRDSFKVIAEYLNTLEVENITKQCMVGYTLRNTLSENGDVSRGICDLDQDSNLSLITERTEIIKKGDVAAYIEEGTETELTGDEIVSMNMMGFTPIVFNEFEKDLIDFMKKRGSELKSEFYLPTVLNNLVQQGESTVKVLKTDSVWFGVTYKEDKKIVVKKINELVESGEYPRQLWPTK